MLKFDPSAQYISQKDIELSPLTEDEIRWNMLEKYLHMMEQTRYLRDFKYLNECFQILGVIRMYTDAPCPLLDSYVDDENKLWFSFQYKNKCQWPNSYREVKLEVSVTGRVRVYNGAYGEHNGGHSEELFSPSVDYTEQIIEFVQKVQLS